MITAKGHNGTVTFDGRFVIITREGALARMTMGKGEKKIPLRSLSAVQWKEPSSLVNGFIQFTLSGGREVNAGKGSRTMAAGQDENSVLVTKKQADDMRAVKDAIEDALAGPEPMAYVPQQQQQPPVPPSLPPAGWYPDQQPGMQRWWDGSQWTEHTQPLA